MASRTGAATATCSSTMALILKDKRKCKLRGLCSFVHSGSWQNIIVISTSFVVHDHAATVNVFDVVWSVQSNFTDL